MTRKEHNMFTLLCAVQIVVPFSMLTVFMFLYQAPLLALVSICIATNNLRKLLKSYKKRIYKIKEQTPWWRLKEFGGTE